MGKMKEFATGDAPVAAAQPVAVPPAAKLPSPKPSPLADKPTKFTYALTQWTIERRANGWHICKSAAPAYGQKSDYEGPFRDIENACLSIARHLFVETANRHTRSIEAHGLTLGNPLYGLKPETKLPSPSKANGKSKNTKPEAGQ
jgi:hypothetical protein